MLFDLHVHSHHSACSRLKPEEILHYAGTRGLGGVCITDHHSMAIRRDFQEGVQANGLCLIFGMEYTTPEGDFLIFGPFEDLAEGLGAGPLLAHVKACGGAAVAAHPFRKNRLICKNVIMDGPCHLVEGVNGRNSIKQNLKTTRWQQQYGVSLTGGSDAHSLEELGAVTTRLTTPVTSRAGFIKALQSKNFIEVIPDSSQPDYQLKQVQAAPLRSRAEPPAGKPVHLHSGGISAL